MADGGSVTNLPSSNSLALPDAPTPEHMARFGRVENVPLAQARATQSSMKGGYPGDLVKGYGDKPVAAKRRDGEYLVYDGHHRAVSALNKGQTHMPMHVIDAHDYAPHLAGRAPNNKESISDDELLRQLSMAKGGAAHPQQAQMADGGQASGEQGVPVAVAGGEHVLAPHEVAFAGMGDMEAGHRALDEFQVRQRKKLIKTLRGLPGPKRD